MKLHKKNNGGSNVEKSKNGIVNKLLYSKKIAPYVFVLPFIITFLVFFIYPIITTITMSFQNVAPQGQTQFIGLTNYKNLLNTHFYTALWNSFRYTFWTLLILVPIPIILAVFLNSKKLVGKKFFRAALFVPVLTSVVVAGIVFRLIFGESAGSPFNTSIAMFGFSPQAWIRDGKYAMTLMVSLAVWTWMGINIIYFLSGLQNIPNELYESANIDGAGPIAQFVYITMPMLKPVIIYVLTISIFAGLSMFTQSYVFWSNDSPQDSGLTIVGYLYQQGFQTSNWGLASAIGIVLLIIVLTLNLIQLKMFGLFDEGVE